MAGSRFKIQHSQECGGSSPPLVLRSVLRFGLWLFLAEGDRDCLGNLGGVFGNARLR